MQNEIFNQQCGTNKLETSVYKQVMNYFTSHYPVSMHYHRRKQNVLSQVMSTPLI